MTGNAERRAARETVAAYHEAELAGLIAHVEGAISRFRAGEIDAFETDHAIFQYSRAAKELWKFCNLGKVEITARMLADGIPVDWWEQGAPRAR